MLRWVHKCMDNIRQSIRKIRSFKSLSECLDHISLDLLGRIAYFLAIIWVLVPLFLMVISLFYDRSSFFSFMFNSSKLSTIRYVIMQQIGYLGLIITMIIILKSFRQKKLNHVPLKTYVYSHLVEILLISFLGWSFIASLFSENINLSFYGTDYRKDGWLSYLAYSGFFGLGYVVFKNRHITSILRVFVIVGTILSLLLLINHPTLNEIFTFYQKSTVFYNPNHMGYYLVLVILSAAYLAVINKGSSMIKIIDHLVFAILVLALIENGSFGPYIAVSVALIFLVIMTWIKHKEHLIQVISIPVLFFIVTFVMNLNTQFLFKEATNLQQGIGDIIENNEDAGSAGSGRWSLWTHSLTFMMEKPIFGYGIENLEQAYLEEGISQDRPHNEFIQVGANTGMIGLILYVSAIAILYLDFFKIKRKNQMLIVNFYVIITGYFVSAFFGNSMYYTTPYFMIFMGLSRALMKSENTDL